MTATSNIAYRHADGVFLVPIEAPPSWTDSYFYVVNELEELREPFEALRCLRLNERSVRRATSKVTIGHDVEFSVFVRVRGALATPSDYVEPWQIQIGAEMYASLYPPPWLTFAPEMGDLSVEHAVMWADPATRAAERELRVQQTQRAMHSASLLNDIRVGAKRRMVVTWFEGDDIWKVTKFKAGRKLHEALTDDATRSRPHLIHFPDGWYVNGLPWLF